jgi:hypothetical protein
LFIIAQSKGFVVVIERQSRGLMLFSGSSNSDPKAASKEARKEIKSGTSEIDRQIRDLDRQEQKTLAEAKAMAKKGDMNAVSSFEKKEVAFSFRF